MGRGNFGRNTNNFNSGMTTPVARMEAIMASLVEDRARMNSINALSKKSNANLGSAQKREDTENSKSKPEATIGTSATVDNKEVTNGEMGSSMTTNATYNTPSKKRKKKKTKNNNPDLGGILSTHESTQGGLTTTKVLEVTSGELISVSAKTATLDANNGDGAPKLTRSQKRKRRKALHKILNANLGSSEKEDTNGEVEVQKRMEPNLVLGGILSARESTQEGLSTTKVVEVTSGDMISAKTTTPDAEVASRKMEDSEATNSGDGAPKLTRSQKWNRRKALRKILNANLGSSEKEDTNLNGEVEVQKRMEPNLALGGILGAHESTKEGLSTTKVVEVTSGDMISAKTTTPDANMVSKGDHTEVASRKMEDSEATNNGDAAPKLTRSQKKKRRKALHKILNANLGSSEKGEDTGISSAGTGDGKSSNSIGKEHAEVAIGEMGSTTNLNGKVEVQKKMESIVGETSLGINAADNIITLKKRKREKMKNDNPDLGGILSTCEGTEEGLSTTKVLEVKSGEMISTKTETPDANMVSKGDHSEVASAKMEESETTNNDNETTNKALEKKMNANLGSLGKREDAENHKGKPEIQFDTISLSSIQDTKVANGEKNSNFNGKEHTKVANFETGSSLTTNLNREVEVQKTTETTIGNTSLGTNATDNTVSEKRERYRKKTKNNNPDLGDIISTHESAQGGVGMIKALEVTCNETVSSKTTTPDANMVSKEEVTNIKIGESETIDVNVNGKDKSKKKPDSENKQPTLFEILNPQYSQSLEASKSETGSGTTSTDKPASKKQKRQKLNKNPDLGDTLSTRESTQKGLSTTKVLELNKDEAISAKTATSDANMVSKEVHTEAANSRTGESEMTNNGSVAPMLTKSQKKDRALKRKLYANLGSLEKREDTENPNSVGTSATVDNKTSMSSPAGTTNLYGNVEVQKKMETSSGTNATYNTTLKKRKRKKTNNNPDSGDNLSTHESTQEGVCTTKVLEVKSDETVLAKIAPIDANMVSKDHSEVANGENAESETPNLNMSGKKKRQRKPKSKTKQPTVGEILDPLYSQNLEAAKHVNPASNEQKRQKINDNLASGDILSTCENTSKVLQAVSADVSQGEEHVKDRNGSTGFRENTNLNGNDIGKEETELKVLEKKLLILDVNGLLADVVSDLPNDIIADKYINRRAIFKRPYVHEFLSFCFERFHVGIWSSRTMRNLVPVVNFLLGDLKKKLLFLWDGCKCTDSGEGTLDVQYKNIVVKDLRKIWDKDGPDKSWVKGTFTQSNTLLVDDSPYKGLLNPKYTGIFPASYSYTHSDDNFLGPNGELQTYLEGLAAADDVKTYVEQHPFGQGVIDEQNPDWYFYSSLIERLNNKPFMECLEENQWKRRRCC